MKLWQTIVAEQEFKIHNIGTVKGKPNMIPRWPTESIRLARECDRLYTESTLYELAIMQILANERLSDEAKAMLDGVFLRVEQLRADTTQ